MTQNLLQIFGLGHDTTLIQKRTEALYFPSCQILTPNPVLWALLHTPFKDNILKNKCLILYMLLG